MNYIESINLEHIVEWRNHIHANPEVSFEEVETSAYIAKVLESFGSLEITRPTRTSVLAVLDTKRPGKTVALRADIDALKMSEETDFDYKSKVDGVMHSCGHDTHAAMLLGAAEVLVKCKDQLNGKIKFIFQHGEELLPGGAIELVEAGVMDGVDQIHALHIFGGAKAGLVLSRPGPLMASSDCFEITLTGHGAHASVPEESVDLVIVGAQIVNALQTIVSRNISTNIPKVISVCQVNIGTADNIIADTGYISGGVRSTTQESRAFMKQRILDIVNLTCQMHGATADINFIDGYSVVDNSKAIYDQTIKSIAKLNLTPGYVELENPLLGGEDFSAYGAKADSFFAFIGGGDGEGYENFNHHPKFGVSEEALLTGAKIHVQIVMDILSNNQEG